MIDQTKMPSPQVTNFIEYLGVEETNFLASFTNFRSEFDAFVHLDNLYHQAINQSQVTSKDDFVVCQFLLLVHFHYYFSSATLLRCHLSEALSSMRTAIDAALSAYRIIADPPAQHLYLQRDKTFMYPRKFFDKAKNDDPAAFPLAAPLLNRRDVCSQYASHADIDVFFHRLEFPVKDGDLLKLQYFQHPKNRWEFAWYYLMLMHTFTMILQVFEEYLVQEKGFVTIEWARSILQFGRHLEELMTNAEKKMESRGQ